MIRKMMGKFVSSVLSAVMFAALLTVASLVGVGNAAENEIKVYVDDKVIQLPDVKPFIDSASARTLVPVRFVSQSLGAQVNWDDAKRTVTITRAGKNIALKIGEKKATVDGKTISFDTAATIKEGRTFVPLRFVSEAYGAQVIWDKLHKDVYIVTKPKVHDAYGTKLYKQFQASLKIKNGVLSGKLPIKSTEDLLVHLEISFVKEGIEDKILEKADSFSYPVKEISSLSYVIYDRKNGKRLGHYSYRSLPDLAPLDVTDY
ncbi:copper amine oxidase N-terminal domain-containing protein [Brevibacillus ginsengisoli]|uniref:copper amine oxidase N-terminal domain-containing protein n=1 Tax=Brevibacillus ginsengisoli TaxID=363854 RepID=UPI003CF80718